LSVLAVALVGACGSGKGDPGPTGKPSDVVAAAPDITFQSLSAHVVGAAPGYNAVGLVRFGQPEPKFTITGLKKDKPAPFGVLQPGAVIDLLRGVVHVTSYGGAQVQGAGTKRYEVDIDLFKAIAATPEPRRAVLHLLDGAVGTDNQIWADVFIDSNGRVRRVLLPVHTEAERPYGEDKHIPQLVSVDYSDFGGDQ
jgi:hypothetical protein